LKKRIRLKLCYFSESSININHREVKYQMSKDQIIGGTIFIVCAIIAIFYVVTLFYPQWLSIIGIAATGTEIQFWIIAVPVFIAFIAIMGIGAWIGWTMATTPPPKPIEEIQTEEKEETGEKK
jgi:predicted DNA-binding transcriptional regulator